MYRVVLIDDEAIIVEGLRKVVQWENYDCVIAGTADSGASGLELIRREKPDILFMDICMPGLDGLNMLADLRSEFPNMQVTILTGYRDFAYAQQAIYLGVTRYLLKPSKMAEILEAVQIMVEKLKSIATPGAEEQEEATAQASAGNFIVNSAVQYIRAHYAERLTLQAVAESCYVSQWHLSKLLSKHVGKNFYDVLNEVRIQEAKRLLEDGSLRIGHVGERVGYTDNAHFARIFKKMTGQSAAEYRKHIQLHRADDEKIAGARQGKPQGVQK